MPVVWTSKIESGSPVDEAIPKTELSGMLDSDVAQGLVRRRRVVSR
jgi:hypothetical protein